MEFPADLEIFRRNITVWTVTNRNLRFESFDSKKSEIPRNTFFFATIRKRAW